MNARRIGRTVLSTAALAILFSGTAVATMEEPRFDSGNVPAGGTYTWTADSEGTYGYKDKLYEGRLGEIVVEAGDGMGQTTEIDITSSGYSPEVVTVLNHSTIRWTNQDSVAHTVTESPEALAMMMEDEGGNGIPGPGPALALAAIGAAALALRRNT